ncbi:TlpA disulfide reductase family protein [Pedobacter nutrimenti]|uniref:TlpA disulfide reductase family protein n=1 Tax=Pedobacter nutrimenti TaxID=1241337 RepID=UPI00292FE8D8|nr:TlpA disulfide reductase family protein [Pedobacter nutrimenti]
MKNTIKILGTIIIILMPGLLLAQSGKYTIHGEVGKLSALAKAYLFNGNNQPDSVLIKNGNFSFRGTIADPCRAALIINDKGTGPRASTRNRIDFYLEPATLTVISPDSLTNAKVTGGALNADNARLTKALAEATRGITRKDVYLAFIKANPNSLISLFALVDCEGLIPDVTEVAPVFDSLSESVRATKAGTAYAAYIIEMKKVAINTLAPDFTLSDTAGNAVSLHDFKGKYVLVDFWASWCHPCRAENPNVVKAYSKYKDKGLNILGVSLDRESQKAAWIKAINDDHLTWTQVCDLSNEATKLYVVQGIPQNFLVGPDGRIIAKNLHGDELENKLAELLK